VQRFIVEVPRSDPLPPFQRLLDEHGDDVLGFLIAAVGPSDAEDCFQETFLAALRAYPRLRDDNLRGWLMTIAHRKAIDHHRGRSRRPTPVADPDSGAPAAARWDGAGTGIWSLVAKLPPKQRSAVALRFVADLPYRELGARLGCSEEAARRNVHEGIKRLREVLA
jgi:RNA polymerase sigma factor (sigma-70 family)